MQLLLCPFSVKQISENDFEGIECLSFAAILLQSHPDMHSAGSFRCSLREEGRAFSFVCLRYLNSQAIDWHPQAMRDFNRSESENSFILHAV